MPMQSNAAGAPQPWFLGSPVRKLRLASGLALFTYVLTHLINLALCNWSFETADVMLAVQKFIWQGIAGTILLYGALTVHASLGLWALYSRRHFRGTPQEALQLCAGLLIPALLANHFTVTRAAWSFYGLNKDYAAELNALWVAGTGWGTVQVAVLILAWTHACLGLAFLFRLRRWFPAWRPLLLTAAVLLPVLALLGFAQGGRELTRLLAEPGYHAAHLGPGVTGTPSINASLGKLRDDIVLGWSALVLLVLGARLIRRAAETRHGMITVSYPGAFRVRIAPGLTVLDASRWGRVPHASVCGGKGRCSTCRVCILWSDAALPEAAPHERALLRQVGADPDRVRLACQLRPRGDLLVAPLVPPDSALDFVAGRAPRLPGEERFVAAMFVDMRDSTWLAAHRTPFDNVFLLGRFIAAITGAVIAAGGRPVQFLGDGVLALFGLDCGPETACRQALRAIGEIEAALIPVSRLFEQETRRHLRFGIGVNCGQAIVGEIGFTGDVAFTALGETVNTAHRLQDAARDAGAQAVVAEAVFQRAGMAPAGYRAVTAAGVSAFVMEALFVQGADVVAVVTGVE
jgi:adenylate cyclase